MKQSKDFNEDEQVEYYNTVTSCPQIFIGDKDAVKITGYTINIHKDGRASYIKGTIHLTPWQWKRLVKTLIEDEMDIEGWSCVDLSWVVED